MPDYWEMDEHLEKLFDQVPRFDETDDFLDPEFFDLVKFTFIMEAAMEKRYGEGARRLLTDYLVTNVELFAVVCRYYFHQGYLAAQAEGTKDKKE